MTVTPMGGGFYRVSDGVRSWTVAVAGPADNRWVWLEGRSWQLDPPESGPRRTRARGSAGDLTAPMPATVVQVMVAPGAQVARGDTVVMLEAMKMELPIRAPQDGVIKAVHCRVGELVQPNVPLVEFEA